MGDERYAEMGRNDEYTDQVYSTYYSLLSPIYYILYTHYYFPMKAMGFRPEKQFYSYIHYYIKK